MRQGYINMTSEDNDFETWVYHALHEAKTVNSSEAKILYKQGWRDSPNPKILFKGIRGKLYWLVLFFRKLIHNPSKLTFLEWFSLIGSAASMIGLIGLVL